MIGVGGTKTRSLLTGPFLVLCSLSFLSSCRIFRVFEEAPREQREEDEGHLAKILCSLPSTDASSWCSSRITYMSLVETDGKAGARRRDARLLLLGFVPGHLVICAICVAADGR